MPALTENDLLPCPRCGGEPEADAGGCFEIYGHCLQSCWVECRNCGYQVYLDGCSDCEPGNWQVVLAAWNRVARGETLGFYTPARHSSCPMNQDACQPNLYEGNAND